MLKVHKTWGHDDWLKHIMNSLNGEPRSHGMVSHLPRTTAVVVLVKPHETKEEAWRRHLKENPQDLRAEVKIFHFYPL